MQLLSFDFALILGICAFLAHLLGYAVYGYYLFHVRIRPNAASWFMWLIGGWIEFLTYDAIGESHWSTSALPLACVIGLTFLCCITFITQMRIHKRGERRLVNYHAPDRGDYILTTFDLGAGLLWVITKFAALANFIAVSTSIISFIPIWKTTYKTNEEHYAPWLIWTFAYLLMFAAVLVQGGNEIIYKIFYPLYYFVLHLGVLLLCWSVTRPLTMLTIRKIKRWIRA